MEVERDTPGRKRRATDEWEGGSVGTKLESHPFSPVRSFFEVQVACLPESPAGSHARGSVLTIWRSLTAGIPSSCYNIPGFLGPATAA